jgi:hypothetical protein
MAGVWCPKFFLFSSLGSRPFCFLGYLNYSLLGPKVFSSHGYPVLRFLFPFSSWLFSAKIFLTSLFLSFLRATKAAFFSPLGLNFPFSHERIELKLDPVRTPSSPMDMPSFFLSPRILSGVRRDAFTSSGVASSLGLASSKRSSFVILFKGANPLERVDNLSLIVLTSLRSGTRVARTSRLARRWISDLMVD